MQKDIFLVGNIIRGEQYISTTGLVFNTAAAAEKHAEQLTVRHRTPHFVFAAVTELVPPEPVCLKVPLKPRFLEVG